jgi:hypothetical protein
MKREIITNWSVEKIEANIEGMPIPRARFFNKVENGRYGKTEIIVPDDLTFDHLCLFIGHKTRVTIETID